MNSPATVLLVDDESGMLQALTRLLEAEDFAVRAYGSAKDFLAAAPCGGLACLVLDIALPGIDGLELQRRLAIEGNRIPIVFLTGHGDIPMSVRAMKTGAVDFLTKPVKDEDLLRAIRAALELAQSRLLKQQAHAESRARFARLTTREREVMAHVIAGKLNKQIGADLGTSEQTIKVHRMNLMEKLGLKSVVDLVRLAECLGVEKAA